MATVLVVEDEFGVAELFEAVLEDEGHRVLVAINGKQGLEMLAKERPDVIFLDYMMPVMDGAGMLRGMAAAVPPFEDIPVVIMSSMPEMTVAERCQGYRVFLRKPFKIAELLHLVEALIERNATLAGA